MKNQLPEWVEQSRDAGGRPCFNVDPDGFYPAILEELDVPDGGVDRFWLETAFQYMKLILQTELKEHGLDPRPERPLIINVRGVPGHKERWALKAHRPGNRARTFSHPGWPAQTPVVKLLFLERRGSLPDAPWADRFSWRHFRGVKGEEIRDELAALRRKVLG